MLRRLMFFHIGLFMDVLWLLVPFLAPLLMTFYIVLHTFAKHELSIDVLSI